MKKIVVFFAFMAGVFCMNAQSELDAYKYIIVKKQYGFQKSPDKYQINSLAKFLLEKSDLNVLFDTDEFPNDLAVNSCLGLKVELLDASSMFSTQLSANFRDCKNKVIYTTVVAKSKAKEYKKAYHEVLRGSLAEFSSYKHKYTGTTMVLVEKVKKEVPVVIKEQEVSALAVTEKKAVKKINPTVEASSLIGTYSNSKMTFIVKSKGDNFELVHPEIGKIADVFKTSKAAIFIVQWTGKTQSRLMEIGIDGSLKIDSDNEVNSYKKEQ